jgi:hypothetical protein
MAQPVILTTQGVEVKRIEVWGQPRQIVGETVSQKYSKQKGTGGVAQVLEYLPSKCEA